MPSLKTTSSEADQRGEAIWDRPQLPIGQCSDIEKPERRNKVGAKHTYARTSFRDYDGFTRPTTTTGNSKAAAAQAL